MAQESALTPATRTASFAAPIPAQKPRWRLIAPAVLALVATTSISSPAFTQDATDFFTSLKAEAEANGGMLTYEFIESFGSDRARANGIKFVINETDDMITIDEMTLSGTEVIGNGGFSFETVEAVDLKFKPKADSGPGQSFTLGRVSLEDYRVQLGENSINPFRPMYLSKGHFEDLSIVFDDSNPGSLKIPDLEITGVEYGQDGISYSMDEALVAPITVSVISGAGNIVEITIGETKLSGVARSGQSGISVDAFSSDGVSFKEPNTRLGGDTTVLLAGFSGSGLFVPDFSGESGSSFLEQDMRLDIGPVHVAFGGKEMIAIKGGYSVLAQYDPDSGEFDFSSALNDVYLDLRSLESLDPGKDSMKPLLDLGYENITYDTRIKVRGNIQSGMFDISSRFGFENMGVIDLALKLDGLTVEFVSKLQESFARIEAAGKRTTRGREHSEQLLAEMSALSVREMQLKLEDASLTRRIVQQQAQKSGQSAGDMAATFPFMVTIMLASFNVPDEFSASVSAAIGAYFTSAFDNDQAKLTLKVAPERPVSFAEIMENATPAKVIEQLDVTISGE